MKSLPCHTATSVLFSGILIAGILPQWNAADAGVCRSAYRGQSHSFHRGHSVRQHRGFRSTSHLRSSCNRRPTNYAASTCRRSSSRNHRQVKSLRHRSSGTHRSHHRRTHRNHRYYSPYLYLANGNHEAVPVREIVSSTIAYNLSDMPNVETADTKGMETPESSAWFMLENGKADEALLSFSDTAHFEPTNSHPKVGYALAAALTGDEKLAIWAMRKAFQIDTPALRELAITDELRKQIQLLLAFYQQAEPGNDSAFMTGALHFLIKEERNALSSANHAIGQGDHARSTLNLWKTASTGSEAPKAGEDPFLLAGKSRDAGTGY